MKVYSLLLVLLVLGVLPSHAQLTTEAQRMQLLHFADSATKVHIKRRTSALQWAEANNVPLRIEDKKTGTLAELQYIDDNGLPIYYQTFNAGAAVTTGTSALYQGGGLGLNLTGKGMKVGVWDGGNVYNHREFTGRYSQLDGSTTDSDHATHVTGTIIASGVMAGARGMAYEAEAITNDWTADLAEMASQAAEGMLLSNHSYGVVVGWYFNSTTNKWVWSGSGTADQDYRFGYYDSNKSRGIDQLAYNAPYYLIVWAAGNDRSDVGDGSRPADGPFDTIGPEGAAKNNLVVGAVRKIDGTYTKPEDVIMSTFSSWGPVDDGRIKPDICGAGVAITSASSSGADKYSAKNGTSMASPNVTGSLLLLQQLHAQQNNGKYMRSATLKALAIHTAKEAGPGEGPDYMYGWGLLDVKAAASLLVSKANGNTLIEELVLNNGQVTEFKILSDGIKPIRATIAWTDLPGTAPAPTLNNPALILVNDLDLRIIDEVGNEVKPYILDPSQPTLPASRGDNFRDNVEQVYISKPGPRQYTVRISHKGTLQTNQQAYSLILEYGGSGDDKTTYYWVGGSGNFEDPAHWSLNSGGTSAGRIPAASDNVVFNEASFPGNEAIVTINASASVGSLRWISDKEGKLVLSNTPTLTIGGSFIIGEHNFAIEGSGTFNFSGEQPFNTIDFKNRSASGLKLLFNSSNSQWIVNSDLTVKEVKLLAGKLLVENKILSLQRLEANGSHSLLTLKNVELRKLRNLIVDCQNTVLETTNVRALFELSSETGSLDMACGVLEKVSVTDGYLVLAGSPAIKELQASSQVETINDLSISSLFLRPGSSLSIAPSTTLTVSDSLHFQGEASRPVLISSTGGLGILNFGKRYKICADYVKVMGVKVNSESVLNVGLNGEVDAYSLGWEAGVCEEILYADFTNDYSCVGSIIQFSNKSSGNPDRYEWQFSGSPEGEFSPTDTEPSIIYSAAGAYTITLRIYKGGLYREYSKILEIQETSLRKPVIVANDDVLTATAPAPVYQWFLNGEPIPGATARSYNTNGQPGSYRVAVYNDLCNLASDPVGITGIEENELLLIPIKTFSLYPNPAKDEFRLVFEEDTRWAMLHIYDIRGALLYTQSIVPRQEDTNKVDITALKSGIYLLKINTNTSNQIVKFIKE